MFLVPWNFDSTHNSKGNRNLSAVSSRSSWYENVENAWQAPLSNSTWANGVFTNVWACDGTPDIDYIFYHSRNSNPVNKLRWTTNNTAVYVAFWIAYGLNLGAYGNSGQTNFCVGDGGINIIGANTQEGIDAVLNSVYLTNVP